MKEGAETKAKFKLLKRRLGMPDWQVVGLLESIWKLGRTSAQQGDIGKLSNANIAACIEYAGDENELIDALVEAEWLDEDPEFRLIIHDWSHHIPNYLKGNLAKYKKECADVLAKRRKGIESAPPESDRPDPSVRAAVLKRDGCCQYCGGEPETIDHVVPLDAGGLHDMGNLVASCLSCNSSKGAQSLEQFAQGGSCPPEFARKFEGNMLPEILAGSLGRVPTRQDKPSQTKSSNDQTSRAPPGGLPWGEFEQDRARGLANLMVADDRLNLGRWLSKDLIWHVAAVASLLEESFLPNLMSSLGGARDKRKYIEGVMRKTMEERGYSWMAERLKVPPLEPREVVGG